MKKTWEVPVILVQQFEANEYVAACWGVGCSVDEANNYERTHYYNNYQTWWDIECSHDSSHCGFSGNQVIYDDNNDGTADRMVEVGTSGLGTLTCTLYSDGDYNTPINVASVKAGQTIYWTTSAGIKVWHHVGTVYETVPGHPNRS